MHDLLQRFTVGKRLTAGFALLLALTLAIAAIGILSLGRLTAQLDSLAEQRDRSTALANELYDQANLIQINLQTLVYAPDDATRQRLRQDIQASRATVSSTLDALDALSTDAQSQALVAAVRTHGSTSSQINGQIAELLLADQHAQAQAMMLGEGSQAQATLGDAIKAVMTHVAELALLDRQQARQTAANARNAMLIAAIAALLGGCLLAFVLTRSLTLPLQRAATAARALANGQLDGPALRGGKDETGQVLDAIQASRQTLTTLIDGIKETGRQHELGNLSWRQDASALDGEYRTICQLLDAQFTDYTQAALLAGRLASRYALGDLSEDFPRVPGDKAELMHALDGVKSSISRINNEILHVSQAAMRGDFSVRGDEAQFQFGFRQMVSNLNQLMATADGSLGQLSQVLRAVAIGDLSHRMEGQYQGVFAQMRDDTNTTVDNLTTIVERILTVSEAAKRGDFSVRSDEQQFQHGFRQILDNLNQLTQTADSSLGDLSQVLRAIASGDLTTHMQGDYQGVFAQMRDDTNATVDNLTHIVGRIQQATSSITLAANEIASGNADLSQRTEQQAANLEETAASMEEMTSTVRQNAEHAQQASHLATTTAQVATTGGKVAGEVVATMQAIEESSRRIADIISVIDGIAFQTNILALNAAVEAARAGEQGRGFAVVASEVRTLAQRSASAAKEIKTLIDDSAQKVSVGSDLVNRAGSTMGEIVTSVQQVAAIIAEISAASQEQSAGIEQVSQTVIQMDEATQQNAALVEEASAAARAMENQATLLSEAVAAFRLARSALSPQPAAAAKAVVDAAAAADLSATSASTRLSARRPAASVADEGNPQWQTF